MHTWHGNFVFLDFKDFCFLNQTTTHTGLNIQISHSKKRSLKIWIFSFPKFSVSSFLTEKFFYTIYPYVSERREINLTVRNKSSSTRRYEYFLWYILHRGNEVENWEQVPSSFVDAWKRESVRRTRRCLQNSFPSVWCWI